jgi:hypothetical protein
MSPPLPKMADLIADTERLLRVFVEGQERAKDIASTLQNKGKTLAAPKLQEQSVRQSELTVDLCKAAQGLIKVLWALEHYIRLHRNDAGEHWPPGGPTGDPLTMA